MSDIAGYREEMGFPQLLACFLPRVCDLQLR